jgi:hypothetical protein
MANPQLLSGARGLIQSLNTDTGQFETLGFATDITINIRQGVRQTYVVGRMNAGAIDSLTYDVDVSIGRVVPVNTTATGEGPVTADTARQQTATAVGIGLEPIIQTFVGSEDLSIALQDKVTGVYVSSIRNCRFSGRSLGTNANDIAQERLNFVGIYDTGYDGENAASLLGYETSNEGV